MIFGCWTSVSRKSVLPVLEELNGLLFYPVQYEGEELSKNVFYTGAAPNQQAIPAVDYLMSKEGGGAKRWVLLGTDYVYPRTTNKILRAFLKSKGVAEADIIEEYTPFGHSDYQSIIAKIKKFAAEDDVGSIMIEENVVSQAGAHYQSTTEQLRTLIRGAGYIPKQRDTLYRTYYLQ